MRQLFASLFLLIGLVILSLASGQASLAAFFIILSVLMIFVIACETKTSK